MTSNSAHQHRRLALILVVIAVAMLGVAYAFVPLYRMFCAVFGIPVPSVMVGEAGTPKPISGISDRTVTVRFMANNSGDMPVTLQPTHRRLQVKLGEPVLTAYMAQSHSEKALDGVATHTIVAMGGARSVNIDNYIDLQQCFCFSAQHYPGEESVRLPLSFVVTPDLPEAIHTITFGYTLFEAMENDPRIQEHPAQDS